MKKTFLVLIITLISLFFILTGCKTSTNSPGLDLESSQNSGTEGENQNNSHNGGTEGNIPGDKEENGENGGETEPGDGTGPENQEYKPNPNAIKDKSIIKLNHKNINYKQNKNIMYIMVRFLGSSKKGLWKLEHDGNIARPKGFALNYKGVTAATVLNFNELKNEQDKIAAGYVTDFDLGFSDFNGNKFYTTFYYGDNNIAVTMNGNKNLSFAFDNFVIWDGSINDDFFPDAHPVFVRLNSSHPLTISIPMEDYNDTDFKNIAYVTVYFDLDKGTVDTPYPYTVVFDGFEPLSL